MPEIIQPSFAKGQLAQELQGRVDTTSYRAALASAVNVIVPTSGGVKNRPGLRFVDFASNNSLPSRIRRFRFNTTNTFLLEFASSTLRIIQDDAFILETAKPVLGVSQGNPCTIHVASHGYTPGNFVTFDGTMVGMPLLLTRRVIVATVVDADHFTIADPITETFIASTDTTLWPGWVSGGNVARVFTVTTPYSAADVLDLKFVQNANQLTITHPSYGEQLLEWDGNVTWTLSSPTYAPSIGPPTGLAVIPNTTGSTTTSYVVTAIDAVTGDESLPSAAVTITNANATISNGVSWTPPASGTVSLYSVYRAINDVYGFIGDTPLTSFSDGNFKPDLSTTPPIAANPFSGAGNTPGVAMYWQQRLIRAGSLNAPSTIHASQTGNDYNMSASRPAVASDAITMTLTSREVNDIRQFAPMADLIAFTAGNEWRITTNGGAFSITNLSLLPQSSWGSSHLEPIVIGLTTLFVTENQLTVRSFKYQYLSNSYQGEEVTLLSSDLFGQYQLKAWSFGRIPDPVIVSVRSDGAATCATWQEEQAVNAWTLWTTPGQFQDVDIVRPTLNPAELDDVVYFVTVRTIQGHSVRMIERLASRRFYDVRDAFFVDCGLSFDQPHAITGIVLGKSLLISCPNHPFKTGQLIALSDIVWQPLIDSNFNSVQPDQLNNGQFIVTVVNNNTFSLLLPDGVTVVDGSAFQLYVSGGFARPTATTVSAAYQLEGQTVSVLADGNVLTGLVVTNGSVALPAPFSRIHVGLAYNSDVQTLRLEAPQGTIQGRFKRIPYCTVRYLNSRGVYAGQFNTDLTEVKFRYDEDYGEPTEMFSGDQTVTMGTDEGDFMGQVFLRQPYPLPMHVLDIIPEMDVDDG